MSFPWFLLPNPPSQTIVLQFASRLSRCPRSPRPFTTSQHPFTSSKRKLQTATAYRPLSLDPTLHQAPRNARVPEPSIATSIPQVNDIRPPPDVSHQGRLQNQGQSSSNVSLREIEAQQSMPTTKIPPEAHSPSSFTAPSPFPETSKPKRQSKLRPRKAAMTITPQAVAQLRHLLQQPDPKMIRVGVKNRGCSGLAYHLEYVDKPGAFDESVEQEGVKVLIDSKALFSIIGSEMDWIDDRLNQRFVFRNPNIKEQCGCGESFMV